MEHLTKHQIVLLTLLVSFVTSIATGIVTVSLINQAPTGTTNTVERVIEDTVAGAMPTNNIAAISQSGTPVSNSLTSAIDIMQKSVVKIGDYGSRDSVSGLGVIINNHGVVMTDKSAIADLKDEAILYPSGKQYEATVIQAQQNGDLVFLQPLVPSDQASSTAFIPISIANFSKLGQTVASLGDKDAGTLGVGVIDEIIADSATSTPLAISTTINPGKVIVGSPLFDISGGLIGLYTYSLSSATSAEFYPIMPIKSALPK